MSQIIIKDLNFGYGSNVVFEDVNLSFDSNFRLGLIGRNGRGKTTLLKILNKELEFQGIVNIGLECAMFPIVIQDTDKTLYDIAYEYAPYAQEWQLLKEFNLIGLDVENLYKEYNILSGGEKTKFGLVLLFLNENKFLLIDEPTDSLDAHGRDVVAEYLNQKSGFILVSHDRSFLDKCVSHILSLNKNSIELLAGNYTQWKQNREYKDNFELAQNKKLESEISTLVEASKQKSNWSMHAEREKKGAADRGFMGAKAARQMKTAKILERRSNDAISQKQSLLHDIERIDDIRLNTLTHSHDTLISCTDISLKYGEKQILNNFSHKFLQHTRTNIKGKNGVGKSSLLKIIAGQLNSNAIKLNISISQMNNTDGQIYRDVASSQMSYSGTLSKASNLKISYLAQDLHNIKGSIREFVSSKNLDETMYFTMLAKLGVYKEHFDTDIGHMSMGQKKKIALAASLCETAHIYIWDEPLNYLDMVSRTQLEQLIKVSQPTMIFVEHDEMFCKEVSTDTVEL